MILWAVYCTSLLCNSFSDLMPIFKALETYMEQRTSCSGSKQRKCHSKLHSLLPVNKSGANRHSIRLLQEADKEFIILLRLTYPQPSTVLPLGVT